jgi:hypothetical protein
MAKLDWEEIEEAAMGNNQYLDYADNGEYKVKVAEVKSNANGSGWFDFTFQDTDVKFPKMSVAFFKDEKVKFRAHYYKEILKLLGCTEEQARKAVEVCEGKDDRELVRKAYAEAFGKLAAKHPSIDIEVRPQIDRDGNPVVSENGTPYSETVFGKKTGLQFSRKENKKPADPLDGAVELTTEETDDLPF